MWIRVCTFLGHRAGSFWVEIRTLYLRLEWTCSRNRVCKAEVLEGMVYIGQLVVTMGRSQSSWEAFLKRMGLREALPGLLTILKVAPRLRSEGFKIQPTPRTKWKTTPEHSIHARGISSIKGWGSEKSHRHLSGRYGTLLSESVGSKNHQ